MRVARDQVRERLRVQPPQKPGRSKQDYSTPADFVAAVEARYGALAVDLAATGAFNTQAPRFVTPVEDSLSVAWHERFAGQRCWLNPPFGEIGRWAKKCREEVDAADLANDYDFEVLFLTPLATANWFVEYVWKKNRGNVNVVGLNGRLCFDGVAPYPKDCMLTHFSPVYDSLNFSVWSWKQ